MAGQRDECPNCGSHFPPGSSECPNCGRPTGEPGQQGRKGPPPQQGGQGPPPGQQGPPPGQNQQGPPPQQGGQGPPPGQQGPPPGQNQQGPPPRQGGQQQSGGLTSNTGTLVLVIAGVAVALLVGTVLLASVISSFVLGLGDSPTGPNPVASFDYDYDAGTNELTVTHAGGDEMPADEVLLMGDIEGDGQTWADKTGAEEVTASDSVTVTPTSDSFEVQIIWQSQDTDDRIILDEYRR